MVAIADMKQLQPIEQTTVTEVVARRLIQLLSDGILRPGDRLPPERDLAQQLRVGRSTVREAVKLLTMSGILEARRGDGTYVRQDFTSFLSQHINWPVLLSSREVDMIVEVREGLEVKAARLAAMRATPEEIEAIAVYRELEHMVKGDLERQTENDLQFHYAIAKAAHNELLSTLMLSLRDILRQYILLSNQLADPVETALVEHEPIYRAIAAREPDAAERAMMNHLARSKRWIVEAGQGAAPGDNTTEESFPLR